MTSQALATNESAAVPDLVRTPALTITAEDVALPRLYIGQFMSKAVMERLVEAGSIYAATGQEDPDPQVLFDPNAKDAKGVLFYVLALRKGKSISDGGELVLFDYDDPNAPPDAWVTYNYLVACPEADTDVPYKLLLTRTGRPAALQINTVLKKNAGAGPSWINAFRLTTAPRENAKGKFWVARVTQVEANKQDIETAEQLAVMLSAGAIEHGSTGEEPAI
jgi:hypothetical protein